MRMLAAFIALSAAPGFITEAPNGAFALFGLAVGAIGIALFASELRKAKREYPNA